MQVSMFFFNENAHGFYSLFRERERERERELLCELAQVRKSEKKSEKIHFLFLVSPAVQC